MEQPVSIGLALQGGECMPAFMAALEKHPLVEVRGVSRSPSDLARLVEKYRPRVLLVTPDFLDDVREAAPSLPDVTPLSRPHTFIVTEERGDEIDLGLLFCLPFRYAGAVYSRRPADDVLRDIKARLDTFLDCREPPCAALPEERSERDIILVLSSRGGVGCTLVSGTLASAVSRTRERVLLVELAGGPSQLEHLAGGQAAKSLLDLVPAAEEISWELLRISLMRHEAGFFILPRGDGRGPLEEGGDTVFTNLIRNLSFIFDVLVVDGGRAMDARHLPVLPLAPSILLVTTGDTLSAGCARTAARFLKASGRESGRFRLLVNGMGPDSLLSGEEIARACGTENYHVLPEDRRAGIHYADMGELPPPSSPLARSVFRVASDLGYPAGTGDARTPVTRRPFLSRLARICGGEP